MAEIRIEALLDEVVHRKASDLHLQVGRPPILRIYGDLITQTDYEPLTDEVIEAIVFTILGEDRKKMLVSNREVDFSFEFGDMGRFRVNVFHERGHLSASMRLIKNEILSTTDLGLPEVVNKFANYPDGMVLVTGPTGSGKSTSMAAIVDKINTERAERIITVEDPIEFVHRSKKSMIVQREVSQDTLSFANALRSALRQDPNVVLVGELRDLETVSAAITISETGHLAFATLHTNSAAQSIDRIIDVFPAHQQSQIRTQISYSLRGILSQRLVPAAAGGLIAATEILVATPAIRNSIRESKTYQIESLISSGAQFGMHTLNQQLADYVKRGIVAYEHAAHISNSRDELDRLLRE